MIKHLLLQKIQNMIDIKRFLVQWFINFQIKKFFDKETSDSDIKNENMSDQQLAEELRKTMAYCILRNISQSRAYCI